MTGVSGIILAAGLSSRMGMTNKLTKDWNGKPLVRHVAEAALASRLAKVVVVTGHDAEMVKAVLPHGCLIAWNGDFAEGMAGSIRCGQYRMQGYSPIMVLLGDMPLVTPENIDALIGEFEQGNEHSIVVGSCGEDMGNPVLFGTAYFAALKSLDGDVGARSIIDQNMQHVLKVDIGPAARCDFDTFEAFD